MTDLIKAAKLWAKTSAKTGATYYVGRMGGCRLLVMENRDAGGEGEPTHWLLIGDAEAGQQPKPEQRPEAVAQRSPTQHRQQRDGWRGQSYRRAPAARPGPLAD